MMLFGSIESVSLNQFPIGFMRNNFFSLLYLCSCDFCHLYLAKWMSVLGSKSHVYTKVKRMELQWKLQWPVFVYTCNHLCIWWRKELTIVASCYKWRKSLQRQFVVVLLAQLYVLLKRRPNSSEQQYQWIDAMNKKKSNKYLSTALQFRAPTTAATVAAVALYQCEKIFAMAWTTNNLDINPMWHCHFHPIRFH